MKRKIAIVFACVLLVVGIYGIIKSLWFINTHIFATSETKEEVKIYYDSKLAPQIESRIAKLDLSTVTDSERANLQKVVRWGVGDMDILRLLSLKIDVAIFSISLSFFCITLGLIILLLIRQNDFIKQIEKQKE